MTAATATAVGLAAGAGLDPAPLLRPRSVAVVGATERPDSYGGNVLANLARWGFEGPVYGVNPKRDEVHGRPCVPGVAELPEPVDAVVVAIPAPGAPAVVAEAGERGCRGVVVLAAGFGEIAEGSGLERELRDAALAARLPVCGPNGNGVIAVGARAPLWGDSAPPLEPGGVALISQSGNVAVNAIGSHRGLRFHTLISTGNEAVLATADWLAALAAAEGVRSVALFCEDDGDGPALAEALARCAERGVGVAVLKVGTSPGGARAAAAHTGALAGDQRVFRALVEEAGGAWAETPHELLELAKALAQPSARPRRRGGVAVLTCSGGDSGIAADVGERLGLELPALAAPTRERLAELLPHAATAGNPLDYTAMIWGERALLGQIVRTVGDDPAIAQLVLLYDQPAGLAPDAADTWARVRGGLADGAREAQAAALIASTLPDLLDDAAACELAEQGIAAIAGLRTALVCTRALGAAAGDPDRLAAIAAAARRTERGAAGEWLGEAEAKQLLRGAGVAVPEGGLAADAEAAVALAERIGWPVVAKLSHPELRHKSEAGALELEIAGERSLRTAFARLATIMPGQGGGVLVERMAEPGVELLVAATTDGVVPALVVGLGGIWTEALDDVAIVPLPASPERIAAGLASLRGAGALLGARGGAALDLDAVGELAARAGDALLEHRLALVELNPVIAWSHGCVAVDAVARRS